MRNNNISKRIKELIHIIENFIESKTNAKNFVKRYEYLYDYLFLKNEELTIKFIGENIANFFDQIHTEVNYFEPDYVIRKEHNSYLSEEQLRKIIKLIYKNLKKKH